MATQSAAADVIDVSTHVDLDFVQPLVPQTISTVTKVLLCLSASVGCAANMFVILATMSSKSFRGKLSVMFLTHQTLTDLLSSAAMLLSHVLMSLIADISGIGGRIFCRLVWSEVFIYCGLIASALNMIALSAERYMMIVYPVTHRRYVTKTRVVYVIAAMWVASVVLNIPLVWASSLMDNHQCYYSFFLDSMTAHQVYISMWHISSFLVPVCVTIYAYGHMFVVIRNKVIKVQPVNHQMPATNAATEGTQPRLVLNPCITKISRSQVNLAATAGIITAVFVLTWSPNQIYGILHSLGASLDYTDSLYPFTLLLVQINSCVNPFIYMFKLTEFRRISLKFLKCKCSVVKDVSCSQTSLRH